LRTRSTERIGDLGRVAPLHTAPATAATAALDPKARGHRGQIADVHLPLIGVAFVVEITTAKWAAAGQGCVEVDVRRARGYHTVAVAPVGVAGLAPGPSRLVFWPAFGKWCRLAFAGPPGIRQRSFELFYALVLGGKCLVLLGDLGSQAVDRLLEAGDNCFQLGDTLVKTHAHLATK
jgi:hypothetical protein